MEVENEKCCVRKFEKKKSAFLLFRLNFALQKEKQSNSTAHQDISEHKQNQEDSSVPPLEMDRTKVSPIPQPRYLSHTNKIC